MIPPASLCLSSILVTLFIKRKVQSGNQWLLIKHIMLLILIPLGALCHSRRPLQPFKKSGGFASLNCDMQVCIDANFETGNGDEDPDTRNFTAPLSTPDRLFSCQRHIVHP